MGYRTIVITGGPCAGKTSALTAVRERLENAGIPTVLIPEAATDLILEGIAPWTCSSVLEFQSRVISLQMEREANIPALLEYARRTADAGTPSTVLQREPVAICDRGVCDSRTYLSEEEFSRALAVNGLDYAQALARYGAVFHLTSVAKDNPDAYTRQNNEARFENAAEAALADERGIRAWAGHPRMCVIGNYETFEEKVDALCEQIGAFLGLPRLALASPDDPLLVSACLLGEACRYDGASVPCAAALALAESHRLIPICPEQLGGLPTPRTPSEIQADGRIVDRSGDDRTSAFATGADEALRKARESGCRRAILKSKSPSCGVRQVYDGSFTGTLIPGRGITAALLAQSGIELFDETDL